MRHKIWLSGAAAVLFLQGMPSIAAELKEYAKSIEGSVYVVDQRRAPDKDKGDIADDDAAC